MFARPERTGWADTYEPPMYQEPRPEPPAAPADPYAVAPGAGEDTAASRLQALFSDQAQKVADKAGEQARKLPTAASDQAQKLSDVAAEQARKLPSKASDQAQKLSDIAGERLSHISSSLGERASNLGGNLGERASSISENLGERASSISENLGERASSIGERAQHLPGLGKAHSSDVSETTSQKPEKAEKPEKLEKPARESRKLPVGLDERSKQLSKVFRDRPEVGVLAAFAGGLTLATILKRLARR